ncbi:Tyrosine-protein phosphatase Lar-like, partial [Geodia barretti]
LGLKTVNVGLYNSGGGIVTLSGGVNFTLDSDDRFTLTCISTGGPATTVTWTRDSTTVTQGTQTVLNDPETAQYTHTLTVAGRLGGLYTCTVSNGKPSSASASITLQDPQPPTDVTAVQDGPTSITVTWTPPDPLDGITGYTISYTGGGSSGSVDVSGGSTNSYTLTGLTNGQTYTISIVATSSGLSSPPVQASVGLVPSAPVLDSTTTVTATTVIISGSVPSGSVVTGYVVQWQRDTSIVCPDLRDDGSVTVASSSFTGHTITGLEPGNRYTITVTVSNGAGSGPVSNAVAAMITATAPSGPPGPITLVTVTPNSAIVQWGEVLCLQRNGEITDYTVTATNSDGMEEGTASVDVDARRATISGLTPSTQYTVSVAAVNSAGTGPSTTLPVETPGGLTVSATPFILYLPHHLMDTGGQFDCYLLYHILLQHQH